MKNAGRYCFSLLVILTLLLGLGAVSAVDSPIDDVTSLNSTLLSCDAPADGDSLSLSDMENAVSANENDISDIKETSLSASDIDHLTISDGSDIVSANSVHTITEETYSDYFDKNGNLNNSLVSIGDTIDLSGNFTNKSFIFAIPLNVTSVNEDSNLMDCLVTFVNVTNTDSTAVISKLNMTSNIDMKLMIVVNASTNVQVADNNLFSSGTNSYPISLVSNTMYSTVANNTIRTVVSNRFAHNVDKETSDNSSWQHSGITLMDSYYNTIDNNDVTVEDSYGVYLCYGHSTSDYNNITNNRIRSTVDNVSFWAYAVYVMGRSNYIFNNTIDGFYRGISATDGYNVIVSNKIYNNTGRAALSSDAAGMGLDYAIYSSNNAIVANNSIYNCEAVLGAGILVGTNTSCYGNYIEIIGNGSGIKIGGEDGGDAGHSNFYVENNTILYRGGTGILIAGYPNNVVIQNNYIDSVDENNRSASGNGVGISVIYQSRYKKPTNVTIENNRIYTSNEVAINLSQSSEEYLCENNRVLNRKIIYPSSGGETGSEGSGITYVVTDSNYTSYFNSDGTLKDFINNSDILVFKGEFSSKGKIILDKSVSIIGDNAKLKDTTVCIYASNCKVSNLTIANNGTDVNKNIWGIYVFEADNATITNNRISVFDKNTSYGIYLCDSRNSNVSSNNVTCDGDNLVFALLNYEVHNTSFDNNSIKAIGTGELYPYYETISIDGVHSISELSKTYGVIFDFSSSNQFTHNDINVTSKVEGIQTPYKPSVNILIGLYIYYDSDNNNISENNVYVAGHDPFLYGVGCSGDDTSKSSTTADNNTFQKNNITLIGDYFVNALILRHNSMNTVVDSNDMDMKAINYTYAVNMEISGFSQITNNVVKASATGNYGMEMYSSWCNNVSNNTLESTGSYTVAQTLYASSDNNIEDNTFIIYSDKQNDPVMANEHPDSAKLQDTVFSLQEGSNRNTIRNNNAITNSQYAVEIDGTSTGNTIANNSLSANGTSGDGAVRDLSGQNVVSGNSGGSSENYDWDSFNAKFNGKNSGKKHSNDGNSPKKTNAYSNSSSAFSGNSEESGSSAAGDVISNSIANALSAAGDGSSDAGESGESGGIIAKEVNALSAESAYSPYAVPLILLFFGALFCYSFLASKEDEEDEHL